MIFSGTMRIKNTKLETALAETASEVTPTGPRSCTVRWSGLDGRVAGPWMETGVGSVARLFWDRFDLRFDASAESLTYRLRYIDGVQAPLQHALLTAALCADVWTGHGEWTPARFLVALAIANLVPPVAALVTIAGFRRRLTK